MNLTGSSESFTAKMVGKYLLCRVCSSLSDIRAKSEQVRFSEGAHLQNLENEGRCRVCFCSCSIKIDKLEKTSLMQINVDVDIM